MNTRNISISIMFVLLIGLVAVICLQSTVATASINLTISPQPALAAPRQVAALTQQAKLTSSDGITADEFGYSIAMDGNTIVVGSRYSDIAGKNEQGAAYVFVKPATGWGTMTQVAKLTASDGAVGDWFGTSIAIKGNTIVVGAPMGPGGASPNQGAAYVFVKPVSGWVTATETARVTASDGGGNQFFGNSVAVDSGVIVVGAIWAQPGGAAYVYASLSGGWTDAVEAGKLYASDHGTYDQFGTSVAISGDTIIAGSPSANTGCCILQGKAYVFSRPPTGWQTNTENAQLVNSDAAVRLHLGNSVAISGNTAVIGTSIEAAANRQGAAYVFVSPGSWISTTETAKLTASDGSVNDYFGYSVAIDSTRIVVGGIYMNANRGAAYVYDKPAGVWQSATETMRLTTSDGASGDSFSFAVAVSGNTIAASADHATIDLKPQQGAAYVFDPSSKLYLPLILRNYNPNNWIDHFTSPQLDPRWSWLKEDNTHWSIFTAQPGFLRITTQSADANHLVTLAPSGDFTITTKIAIVPTQNYQHASLFVNQDDSNYLSANFSYVNTSRVIDFWGAVGGVQTVLYNRNLGGGELVGGGYLRIARTGNTYTGYFSADGISYQIIKSGGQSGMHTASFTNLRVGITASNGGTAAPEIPADFDFFQMQVP